MEAHPQNIGDYQIVLRVAEDEIGDVYKARQPSTSAEVFLRLFREDLGVNLWTLTRIVLAIKRRLGNDDAKVLTLARLRSGQVYIVVTQLDALQPTAAEISAAEPSQQAQDELTKRLTPTENPGTVLFGISEGLQEGPPRQSGGMAMAMPMGAAIAMPGQQELPRAPAPANISLSLPVPAILSRILSREPLPDPVEQAFRELDPGWFSVDAPTQMQVGVAVKISAGAIRQAINRELLASTLENEKAQIEPTSLGRLLRVELIPDSEADFQVRAMSVAEQPVLSTEPTRWEWLVTPLSPGEQKALRVIATNLVDVNGQRIGKSHPVKTLHVRVQVRADEAEASISSASLRKICDEAMRLDADFEAFCLDYYPSVAKRFARGMERVEKLNLLFLAAPADRILHDLKQAYPEVVAAIPIEPPPAPLDNSPPQPLQATPPVKPVQPLPPRKPLPEPQQIHIVIPIWALVLFVAAFGGLLYFFLRRH